MPWFGSSTTNGVPLVGRSGLGKLLGGAGALTGADRETVARFLATRSVTAAPN